MTMTFFLHESIQPNGSSNMPIDVVARGGASDNKRQTGELRLLLDKLRIPETDGIIERERLTTLLDRSVAQFPATMVSGRAGTGKTALVASFAKKREKVGWYTLETTDVAWATFSRYLSYCLLDAGFKPASAGTSAYEPQNAIASFLVRHFLNAEKRGPRASSLIVLDDVHHIFDAEWFEEFFKLMLYSLPPNAHLILLCRSKPPAPLWRLRSKQVLNVIDEDQLAFTTEETAELFEMHGRFDLGPETARVECFGRVSKLLDLARVSVIN